MLYIGIIISFLAAFLLGFKKKRFIFLILDLFFGLGVGILNVYLYLVITPPLEVGLGIIALAPALFVLFPFINLVAALTGGVIGTLAGRRSKKSAGVIGIKQN